LPPAVVHCEQPFQGCPGDDEAPAEPDSWDLAASSGFIRAASADPKDPGSGYDGEGLSAQLVFHTAAYRPIRGDVNVCAD
jgi:hypothetical protein